MPKKIRVAINAAAKQVLPGINRCVAFFLKNKNGVMYYD